MEAFIVIVVMHCGMVEVLLRDDPQRVEWAAVSKDEQRGAAAFIKQMEDKGARVITIQVKDAKCATST